jgi:hypothetical protein
VQTTLKEGGSAGESRQSNWLRSLLVVAEVAAAFVLLIGAGLMIKSFINLQRVEAGLRPENTLTTSGARFGFAWSAIRWRDQSSADAELGLEQRFSDRRQDAVPARQGADCRKPHRDF